MSNRTTTQDIIDYCNERLDLSGFKDFPGAANGLQLQGKDKITKIGAAVDAGLEPFKKAIDAGVDLLIVHHGMFWTPMESITGGIYDKLKLAIDAGLAVYSAHLPLDGHKELGNNAQIAKALDVPVHRWFLEHAGQELGAVCRWGYDRKELRSQLENLFPGTVTAMEFGSENVARFGISSGSGKSVVAELPKENFDTLITGELTQASYNYAQEHRLNLYACGHYHTETFGVKALAQELSEKYDLPWTFIETDCPL